MKIMLSMRGHGIDPVNFPVPPSCNKLFSD